MADATATTLGDAQIETFLGAHSVGTLSLAKDGDSYAIPVGYTFDPESREFYFRLGYAPGSRKREFVEATNSATFVVADDTDEGWHSVVAEGYLEHVNTVEDLAQHRLPGESTSAADREQDIPFYHVFDAPEESLFALVRLDVTNLSGVAETTDRE
ncbi:pyridoxamine 5'-phosphate oxidase family protein [Salinirubrum litoreum]|uniref:Pyridoxamine 5'-phosphate oxidase family protein n=1 Tax=Salinirubrum litoreum TaxID=1126234 RepID=A0ABD5RAZ6_9EURY|nr:pyridoxamine 5'-phosphate oxidase family protein [Salinirubrum litoreum]